VNRLQPAQALRVWLLTVCVFIAAMVILGGYVRLTRSGLSIVEWQVVTGVWPPLSQAAWESVFEKYRQTPEFRHINSEMTLADYKAIYTREYLHRLLGRLTGLVYVLPPRRLPGRCHSAGAGLFANCPGHQPDYLACPPVAGPGPSSQRPGDVCRRAIYPPPTHAP